MPRHGITDAAWAQLQPFFPVRVGGPGRPPADPRLLLDGIFWCLITGAPWRDLPSEFGPWQTVYDHFATWRDNGTFCTVKLALQIDLLNLQLLDDSLWSVDGTSIRASRAAAGGGKRSGRTNPRTTRWAGRREALGPKRIWWWTAVEFP